MVGPVRVSPPAVERIAAAPPALTGRVAEPWASLIPSASSDRFTAGPALPPAVQPSPDLAQDEPPARLGLFRRVVTVGLTLAAALAGGCATQALAPPSGETASTGTSISSVLVSSAQAAEKPTLSGPTSPLFSVPSSHELSLFPQSTGEGQLPFLLADGGRIGSPDPAAGKTDGGARETPVKTPRTYPKIVNQKGDYVAHGINFSTLITNEEFTDPESLSTEQIQSLLERMDSFLAEYQQDGRSAATIIHDAAVKHKINPQVILVTLEKENSLVTRTEEPPKWVMRSAMGYGYDDGGSSAGKKSNFAYQVDNGTRLLRELYEEGQQKQFPARMRVDYGKRTIRINNAATWSLMRYTPHTRDTNLRQIGGGNHSFRRIMHIMDRQVIALDSVQQRT